MAVTDRGPSRFGCAELAASPERIGRPVPRLRVIPRRGVAISRQALSIPRLLPPSSARSRGHTSCLVTRNASETITNAATGNIAVTALVSYGTAAHGSAYKKGLL